MPERDLLDRLEDYYDTVPRSAARTEEVGPFTLFVRTGPGWPFYARPRRGAVGGFEAGAVREVVERQRRLGVPRSVEWVHETTPALAEAAEKAGLTVSRHRLMVLPADARPARLGAEGVEVRLLRPDDAEAAAVRATIEAAFRGTDTVVVPEETAGPPAGSADTRLFGAYRSGVPVGGGSHSPRGTVTELTGIAVLPRARRHGVGAAVTAALVHDAREHGCDLVFLSAADDDVAAIYARLGFESVATACIAEADGFSP